jgi:hypothetical protein
MPKAFHPTNFDLQKEWAVHKYTGTTNEDIVTNAK